MQNSGGFMSAASAFGNTGASIAFGGGVQPNTSGSAFGSSGGAFNNTGSAFSGNSSASAFGSNTSNPSAFGGGFGSGGGRGGAFNNSMSNSNPHQHGGITASDGSGNTGFARGSGRGRGNISYRGGRGGAGGSWGSANKTYIAPGLQQQQPNHPHISSGFAASGTGGTAELNGASGFAFPAGPSNRGRGGQTAGRGRGGRGGIAPGQHRSLQWRADGSHNQQSTDAGSMAMDDSSMGMATPPQERSNSSAFGQSGQLQHQQQPQQAGPSTPSFSAFGVQGQSQGSSQFGGLSGSNPAGSVFGSSQPTPNQWQSSALGSSAPTSATGAFSSAFGGQSSSLTSSSSSQNIHSVPKGVSNNSAPSSQNSIFASPTPRAAPGNNSGASSGASPAFSAQRRSTPVIPESSTFSSSRQNANNQLEDSESRLARFTAVPIGNRFEELKDKRVHERDDAIRRGDIPDPKKPVRLEDAISFIGTCRDMCPEFERHEREYQQNVEKFEKIPGTEHIDHSRAVKAFARPAAGADQPLPSDVRPPDVLLSTLAYLMEEIVIKGDLADSHAFVRDRTRSIRQDFTLQNHRGPEAIEAHEIIARYHILCIHQLCEDKNFSEQQEMEQLRKVLTSLQEFYDDMRTEGTPCPNEAEFRAYHMLSHLQDPDMMRQAQILPHHIFLDPYIQTAAEVNALTRRNNDVRRRAVVQSEASPNFFSRFFKMVAGPRVTYLMACLLEPNFGEIRKGGLKALNKSYLDQHEGVLVSDLVNILGFDDEEECITNCYEYELELANQSQPAVIFGRKDQVSRRRIFKEGAVSIKQHRNERIVEAKRQYYDTLQIIYGETARPKQRNAIMGSIGLPSSANIPRGLTSAGAVSRLGISTASAAATAAAASAASSRTALSRTTPSVAATPTRAVNFGAGGSVGVSQAPGNSAFSVSREKAGSSAPSVFQQPLVTATAPVSKPSAISLSYPAVPSTTVAALSANKAPSTNALHTPSTLNPAAPSFTLSSPSVPSFTAPKPIVSLPPTASPSTSSSAPGQQPPSFAFGTSSSASSVPFSFTGSTSLPLSTGTITTSSTPPPPSGASFLPSIPFTATGALSSGTSIFSSQPAPPSFSVPPAPAKSDANNIVSRRGKVFPRTMVEAVMNEFVQKETDRLIRVTAAQISQEVIMERSLRRAKEREEAVRQESMLVLSTLMHQITNDLTEEILAELYRETSLQRRVISQWKDYTAKCLQRAEELRRRQEHFLANVRAMGSSAGLVDASPMAVRIRDYNAQQQRIHGTHVSARRNGEIVGKGKEGIKAMVEAVSNKRKRLLSIGQEGSPDLALVAGLRKVVAPKREMWAPLPVFRIVESSYHGASAGHSQNQQLAAPARGPALMKRRWRLFVNTPNFKDMTSKWLLTKLGIDMGRHTKAQQRSGTMVAVHRGPSTDDENTMDVVVHGSEDQSVKDLLGMSKYSIMETAAFIFEFSKLPFVDRDATDTAIRGYWEGEHDRLVRFLSCFPKVKQPVVFIIWTEAPEIWERVSPHMVEYLQLDAMVVAPQGPLLSYRFLRLDMSSMKLDPYIVGSLEWLASETKDFFEDPAVLLEALLDKYRPIYEWALTRMSLAEGPMYSQFDEDDEEEAHMWRLRVRKRKQMQESGGKRDGLMLGGQQQRDQMELQQPRNMFVETAESGFNLAVKLFNMELESIAQTIETKGQGETREGAVQEGRVKDAMARFIRQAELPEMKRGAVQDRMNFGMDSRSALSDFIDVYVASLGGLAKEQQNLESKATLRQNVWSILTLSKEDRVPLEDVFAAISSQVLQWVKAGILDTERFSVRIRKWEQQRSDLMRLQGQYRTQQRQYDQEREEEKDEEEKQGEEDSNKDRGETGDVEELAFAPILIHDEVDVEGNVFDFESTVQSEVRAWEKSVKSRASDREERALAVERTQLEQDGAAAGASRKRSAPERPRDAMKKSRVELVSNTSKSGDDTYDLYLRHTISPTNDAPSPVSTLPIGSTTDTKHPTGLETAPATLGSFRMTLPQSSLPSAMNSSTAKASLLTTAIVPAAKTTTTTTTATDRMARLRSLIKEVKETKHLS